MRRSHFVSVLVAAWIGLAASQAAGQPRTFYIDYSGGSNSNPGTKASPWKTHPYMQTASACTGTGSAPSYTHQASDRFIFKGGVSWPAACFQMSIPSGGTSSAQDYYGVDTSWYAGASFSRPKFDLAYAVPTGQHVVAAASGNPGYMTFDNIEILHQGIAANGVYGTDQAFYFYYGATGTILENLYVHDWATNAHIGPGMSVNHSAGAIYGGITLKNSEISDEHGHAYDASGTLLNGAANGGAMGGACENCREVSNSVFHGTVMGCFTVYGSCHDNEFYHIYQGTSTDQNAESVSNITGDHTQVIEDDEPSGGNAGLQSVVYNNLIHDNRAGVNIFVREYSYVFNNVMWNNGNNYAIRYDHDTTETSSFVGYTFNNTVDATAGDKVCISAEGTGGPATVYVENNICITSDPAQGISGIGAAKVFTDHNYMMSPAEAAAHGFTPASLYAPTASDPNVVATGLNLSVKCQDPLAALCEDAEGAPWYGGTAQSRPTGSSAWTLGAYVWPLGSPSGGGGSGGAGAAGSGGSATDGGGGRAGSAGSGVDAGGFAGASDAGVEAGEKPSANNSSGCSCRVQGRGEGPTGFFLCVLSFGLVIERRRRTRRGRR